MTISKKNTILVIGSALALILLGGTVIFGWYTHDFMLVQVFPSLAPMQYNTALCFALSGLALLMSSSNRLPTLLVTALVGIISSLSLSEYLFSFNLGIDNLFVEPYVTTRTSHPGRMSPLTGIAFVLTTTALLLNQTLRRPYRIIALEALGFITLALALTTFLTYLAQVDAVFAWKDLTRMAIHTAVGFIILSIGIITLAWRQYDAEKPYSVPLWVPASLFMGAVLFDLHTPLGVASGILYIPMVFCALWFKRPYTAFIFALVGMLLTISGYYTSPDIPIELWHILANRTMAIVALWIIALIVYSNSKKTYQIQKSTQSLAENEAHLRLIVDGVVDYAIIMLDTQGNIKTWNSGAEHIKGYKADEIIGQHFSKFYTEDDVKMGTPWHALYVAENRGKYLAEGWRIRKDGSQFWASVVIDALYDSDKKLIGFVKITRDISEKRAIEQALQQEKIYLETVLNTSVDSIITITSKGIIESFNPAAEAIFGYRAEEIIGKNVSTLIPEPDKSQHDGYIRHYLNTGEGKIIGTGGREIRALRKNGSIFPAVLGVNFFEINGKKKFVGSVRDVTKQKNAEAKLKESEERYVLAVRGASVGIWDWDVKHSSLFWSNTFKDIVGVSDKNFTPELREFEDRLHPEDHDFVMEKLGDHVKFKTPYNVEYRLRREDGSYVWIHAKGQAQWDASGNPTRMAGSVEDITARKEAEMELQKRSKQFLNLALSSSNLSVWEWDIRSGKLSIDDRLAEILGYNTGEIRPSIDSWEALINPKDLTEYAKNLEKHFDDKTPVCEAELRMLAKNGEWRWILSRGNVVEYDSNGSPVRAAGTYHDITNRKKTEEELRRVYNELLLVNAEAEKAKASAEDANRAKSDFLSNMSHEIRTPMNAIVGVTNLLQGMRLNPQQRHYTEIASTSAHALLQIIDDILDLSKIEAGKLALEEVPFDLQTLCEEISELMAVKTREKRLEFLLRYMPGCPCNIVGDPVRIRQVIMNLCSNAIKFTETGHVLLSISSESTKDDHVILRISVTDTGVGVPEEKMGTIFGKFEQADSSTTRKYGGTGIGLSISMQLVQLMHGAIAAESVVGEGSTFWFRIVVPYTQDEYPGFSPNTASLKGLRVMVVDDNAVSCEIIRDQLVLFGLDITTVTTYDKALAQLKKAAHSHAPYDCALIDYVMPGMDGLQMMKTIRQSPELDGLQCILVSSQSIPGDISAVKQYGFDGYLAKPLYQTEIVSMIALLSKAKKEGRDAGFLTRFSLKEPANENQREHGTLCFEDVRVLLVEDNWANQEVMNATMGVYGIHTMVAADGKEAIAHINEYMFDLVFMDCQMPVMDGFEATAAIRLMEREHGMDRMIIIALTANAMKSDKEHCLQAGMDDYLSKPINEKELEAVLCKWLPASKRVIRTSLNTATETGTQEDTLQDTLAIQEFSAQEFFNLARLDTTRRMLGKRFPEVIQEYLEDAERYILHITQGLEKGDVDLIIKNSHPLKSSSASFGIIGVSEIAALVERSAKDILEQNLSVESIQPLLPQLQEAFAYASLKLKNFLNKVA